MFQFAVELGNAMDRHRRTALAARSASLLAGAHRADQRREVFFFVLTHKFVHFYRKAEPMEGDE